MRMFLFTLRNNLQITLLTILLSLALTTVSCTKQSTNELPSDETISESIQAQFISSTAVPADNIEISTHDGIVTLNGSTTNLLAKQKATAIAEATGGVISVINNLKVTVSRPDKALKKDVARALGTDPATENWEINSSVNNGLVTLKGAVDSWQEKKLAGKIASGVKGVKEIENSIIIADNEDRKASDIKAEVESSLMYDSRIRDNMINVEATKDTVALSGSVGSATEKRFAMQKARVAGVEKVVADELEVHPEYESTLYLNDIVNTLTPDQIETAITKSFAYDPRVPASQITVEYTDGTAVLTGSVKNLNSKLAAAGDARNTAGVNKVKNNIKVERKVIVKPDIPTTDEGIRSRIKEAIRRDPYVEEAYLTVNVNNGMVVIKGDVNSQFEKEQVEEVAQDVKGVIYIDNQLKIKPESGSTT